ncbi:MAG: hypothetical protein FWF41_07115, partial [Betaproteobacteria bacterium]|nr:hypothetical protein [Betaproteobacteria bacterium]
MNILRHSLLSVALGLLGATLALFASTAFSSDEVLRVEGAPVTSAKAEAVVAWRAASNVSNATAVTFMPLPATALKALQEENAPDANGYLQAYPIKIGVNRNADTEIADTPAALNWQSNGNGYVAQWAITSPEAKELRVSLRIRALPDNAELRFSGSAEPDRIIGVVSGQEVKALLSDSHVYWTPVTEGETQNIEIYLPSSVSPSDVNIRLGGASHIFTSAQDGLSTAQVIQASLSCEVDVACKFSSLGTGFQNASKAVARTVVTDAVYSYGCTGTLLNSSDNSQIAYFWSAAHCAVSSAGASAQSLMNTLNTFWFDEASSCGGSQKNSNYTTRTGGAQILHNQISTDTLLLRLNDSVPANAYFAGWDSNRFTSGAMIGIHHPSRDVKKVSAGKGEGKTCDAVFSRYFNNIDNANLTLVSWSEGLVESASSGSGVFTLSNGAYYLRGGLSSGAAGASCSDVGRSYITSNNVFCYSSISLVYNSIKQWLDPATTPPSSNYGPTRQYTGQWMKADESGWGLTVLLNFPTNSRYIFVPWYTYDSSGKAFWYIFEGADGWVANDKVTLDVYRLTGPAWGVLPFNSNNVVKTKAGTATLTFTSATAATFTYTVD